MAADSALEERPGVTVCSQARSTKEIRDGHGFKQQLLGGKTQWVLLDLVLLLTDGKTVLESGCWNTGGTQPRSPNQGLCSL